MQDAETQSVTETGKVRKEWQMSWVISSPTKWGCSSFKMKCLALENCIQTTCMLKHEAILFYGFSRRNSFYVRIIWIFISFIYTTMMSWFWRLEKVSSNYTWQVLGIWERALQSCGFRKLHSSIPPGRCFCSFQLNWRQMEFDSVSPSVAS